MPDTGVPSCAAVQLPLAVLVGLIATSLTTTDVGTTFVRVLLVRSRLTPRLATEFGVMVQVQQEISCSSGAKA